MTRFITITILIVLASSPLSAAGMGVSDGHDLDALWEQAKKQYDLSEHDGIVLLESRRVTITAQGDRKTRVHRVVWIGSARGIHQYADLRVPYNSANSTIDVVALRTWRDGRWWPGEKIVSPTAVVETLPYAVALADDYTTMRETMLLHDGVELPCIMETIYEIGARGIAANGTCGHWVFPQGDAAVRVQLTVRNSGGRKLIYKSGNGAPDPLISGDSWTWTMENVGRIGAPAVTDPAVFAPYVSWTTWPDWRTAGRRIADSFDEAAVLNEDMTVALHESLRHTFTPASRARAVVSLVNENVRAIHYDCSFWNGSPRPASRTWETAYGHDLDRAVLAAALFRTAGLDAEPVFRSTGFAGVDTGVPGLLRFDHIAVHVTGATDLDAYYDPGDGVLDPGVSSLFGRTAWFPAGGGPPAPFAAGSGDDHPSGYELALTLEPGEKNGWTVTGYLGAGGLFSPFGEMSGLGDQAESCISELARSVLDASDVTGYNLETFMRDRVTAGFSIKSAVIEPDDHGRVRVGIAQPRGGIISRLPDGLHLYDERRDSPVVLQGGVTQRLSLRVKTGDREVVHLPENAELQNSVGRFSVTSTEKDGWVTVETFLSLEKSTIPPESWTELRALLLEAAELSHRTVLLSGGEM